MLSHPPAELQSIEIGLLVQDTEGDRQRLLFNPQARSLSLVDRQRGELIRAQLDERQIQIAQNLLATDVTQWQTVQRNLNQNCRSSRNNDIER